MFWLKIPEFSHHKQGSNSGLLPGSHMKHHEHNKHIFYLLSHLQYIINQYESAQP